MHNLEGKCGRLLAAYRFAADLGGLSLCNRFKVGCAIVSPDVRHVFGIGLNGPPSGASNDRCDPSTDPCGCAHAEVNALVKIRMQARPRSLIMMATRMPCQKCAAAIIESSVVGLVVCPTEQEPSESQIGGHNDMGMASIYALDVDTVEACYRRSIGRLMRKGLSEQLTRVFCNYGRQ